MWTTESIQVALSEITELIYYNQINLKDASKGEEFLLTGCIVSSKVFALISPYDKRSALFSEYNTDVRDE